MKAIDRAIRRLEAEWSEVQAHKAKRPVESQTTLGRSQRNHSRAEAGPCSFFGGRGSEEFQEDGCVMTKSTEQPPTKVPLAQQVGPVLASADHPLWRWAKPCVWTARLLTTLIQGVEGDPWFRLFDKVFAERNLLAAFQQVARNDGAPGVDHVTTSEFERQLPDSVWELADRLKSGTFQPQCIRRVHIPKPGTNETRPLGIPTVRDRVVQAAIVNVIEPIFERGPVADWPCWPC